MLSDTVGDRLTTWRQARGWNRERLAEECARYGMPELTHAAITNIESGRRKDGKRRRTVSVDELAVLALALCIPPLALLSPYPDSRGLDFAPNMTYPSYFMYTWFTGDEIPPFLLRGSADEEVSEAQFDKAYALYFDAAHPILQVRLHGQMLDVRADFGEQLTDAMKQIEISDPDKRALAEAHRDYVMGEIERVDESIVMIREEMRSNNWPPPVLPPAITYLEAMTMDDFKRRPGENRGRGYLEKILAGAKDQDETDVNYFKVPQ